MIKMSEEKTTNITNAKQLIALAKAFNQTKSKIGSINGEIGERIALAVENGNLHAGAFKFVCSLARKHEKDEHKALEFWRQVLVYHEEFEKSGLFGEQHVGDLAEMAGQSGDEDTGDADAVRNAKALQQGIGQLPDEQFDDATADKPSRRSQKASVGAAPGSYKLQ
jgi:hypothetical protein